MVPWVWSLAKGKMLSFYSDTLSTEFFNDVRCVEVSQPRIGGEASELSSCLLNLSCCRVQIHGLKDWTELKAKLLSDTGVTGSREYRKAWGMIHLRPVLRGSFGSDCIVLGRCWQSLKAASRFSKVASFLEVSWGKLGKNWLTVEGNDLMLAMSHGASSVQGGQGWLIGDQRWFGSHLMREKGRNHENKRMEMRDYSAGLVNGRNDPGRCVNSMPRPCPRDGSKIWSEFKCFRSPSPGTHPKWDGTWAISLQKLQETSFGPCKGPGVV